jgi:hypothetical protein
MNFINAPKDWAGVIDSKVPDIVKLIAAAWKRVPPGAPDEREDNITTRLCIALQRSRTMRKMMFYIQYQPVELDPATGEEFGRMDIAFYPSGEKWVPREDIYFCLECKRLNVIKDGKPRAYATEYVTLGMARFVSGQYARAVLHGCMVGYVRDGDVPRAIANIDASMKARHAELQMDAPGEFVSSAFFPRLAYVRETRHKRGKGQSQFRIHHMFMAGDPAHVSAMVVPEVAVKATRLRRKARRKL